MWLANWLKRKHRTDGVCSVCRPRLFSVAAEPSAHGGVQSRECRVRDGGVGARNFTLSDRFVLGLRFRTNVLGKPTNWPSNVPTAKQLWWAAVLYGLSVHVKIYPVTYALPIALTLRTSARHRGKSGRSSLVGFVGSFLNRELLLFAGVSGGVFFTLSTLFYHMWVDVGKSWQWNSDWIVLIFHHNHYNELSSPSLVLRLLRQVWLGVSPSHLFLPSDQKRHQTQLLSVLLHVLPECRYPTQTEVKGQCLCCVQSEQILPCWCRQQVELVFGPGCVPPAAPPAAGGLLGLSRRPGLLLLPAHRHLCLFQQSLHITGV